MKQARAATIAYAQPPWAAYNAGLATLAEGGVLKIARGCGHFVQKDDPAFVAAEVDAMLDAVTGRQTA
jgi:pimeloyl-ACP methyl ester carboxylesterase